MEPWAKVEKFVVLRGGRKPSRQKSSQDVYKCRPLSTWEYESSQHDRAMSAYCFILLAAIAGAGALEYGCFDGECKWCKPKKRRRRGPRCSSIIGWYVVWKCICNIVLKCALCYIGNDTFQSHLLIGRFTASAIRVNIFLPKYIFWRKFVYLLSKQFRYCVVGNIGSSDVNLLTDRWVYNFRVVLGTIYCDNSSTNRSQRVIITR